MVALSGSGLKVGECDAIQRESLAELVPDFHDDETVFKKVTVNIVYQHRLHRSPIESCYGLTTLQRRSTETCWKVRPNVLIHANSPFRAPGLQNSSAVRSKPLLS